MKYQFMIGNARVYKAPSASEQLSAHGIEPVPWPVYSPVINPIENVWALMELYLQERYQELERSRQRSKVEVRTTVLEAW